jgi:flagellar secretion chaperone FliS
MNNPSQLYRQQAVRTASPLGLVVLLYDSMLISLNRGIRAMDAGQVEVRVKELNHALTIIDQLQRTLDFENGADVAVNLNRLYDACRTAIVGASFAQIREPLVKIAAELQTVRDAWWTADRQTIIPNASTYSYEPSPAGAGSWSA